MRAFDLDAPTDGPPRARNPHDDDVDHWLMERERMQPHLRYALHVEQQLAKAREAQRDWAHRTGGGNGC